MTDNDLILMMGMPRSGKSTVAKELGYPMVNPDSIRLALHGKAFEPLAEPMVWTIAKYMVKSLFIAGHGTVILDATNITRARRKEWDSKTWDSRILLVDTPLDVCIARAKKCDFPVNVVKRMYNQMELPSATELIWETR